MLLPQKQNTETRGRPRKQETRTLSPIYKQKFSDNSAVIHTSFLIYVFQVFVDTKNQKRVGHKDGGFTLYDKIDTEYCFDNIQKQLQEWGCASLTSCQNLQDFVKLLPALGPRIILREICLLINYIVQSSNEGQSQNQIYVQLTNKQNEDKLDEMYPYMRFVEHALHQLKMDKIDKSNLLLELIRQRVLYLWPYLLRIIIHTVLNCTLNKAYNKYFKPFFSDAENPGETHIGQLNLDQIVIAVKRHQSLDKNNQEQPEQENLDRPRKMRSFVDVDGTRAVVQIIKAPESLNIERKNIQNIGLVLQSPTKLARLQSQPVIFNKGFAPVFRQTPIETSPPLKQKQKSKQTILGFKSSWKSLDSQQQEGMKKMQESERKLQIMQLSQSKDPDFCPQKKSSPKQSQEQVK